MRSGGTPAYFRRSASSAARVPLQVARRTRGARTSKSASQTQETSFPSAVRSLRMPSRSCSPGSRVSVRRTSLAPAGFFTSRSVSSRSPRRSVSARPNAASTASRPAATSASGAPRVSASAGRGERVVDVVEAGQRDADVDRPLRRAQRDVGAAGAVEDDPCRRDREIRSARVAVRAVVAAEVAEVDGVVDVRGAAPAAVLGVRRVRHARPARRCRRRRRSTGRRRGRGRGRRRADRPR